MKKIEDDDDAPTWTREDFKKARRLKDDYPEMVEAFIAMRKPKISPSKKAKKK